MDRISSNVVAELVGFAVAEPALYPTSRQPNREASGVMIAPVVVSCELSLAVVGSTEFASPNHQSIF